MARPVTAPMREDAELYEALKGMVALLDKLWPAVPWGKTFNLPVQELNEAPIAAKKAIANYEARVALSPSPAHRVATLAEAICRFIPHETSPPGLALVAPCDNCTQLADDILAGNIRPGSPGARAPSECAKCGDRFDCPKGHRLPVTVCRDCAGLTSPPPAGPWRVERDHSWYVIQTPTGRLDGLRRGGLPGVYGGFSKQEAIAVRDALNRVACGQED